MESILVSTRKEASSTTNKVRANHHGALTTEKDPRKASREKEKARVEEKVCLAAGAEAKEEKGKALMSPEQSAPSVTSQATQGRRAIKSSSCSKTSPTKNTSAAGLPRRFSFTASWKML